MLSESSPDVVVITETFLDDSILDYEIIILYLGVIAIIMVEEC